MHLTVLQLLLALLWPLATPRAIERPTRSANLEGIPKFVYDIYTTIGTEPECKDCNAIRSFEADNNSVCRNGRYHFYFSVSTMLGNGTLDHIKKATLRFHAEGSEPDVYARIIYDGMEVTNREIEASEWHEFEMAEAVDEWKRSRSSPNPFHVEVALDNKGCDDAFKLTLLPDDRDLHPLLVVYSYDEGKQLEEIITSAAQSTVSNITKRDASASTNNNNLGLCQKFPLTIPKTEFNEILKKDDIELIIPENVVINMCGGTCQHDASLYPNHAALLSWYAKNYLADTHKFEAHCVPSAYAPLVIVVRTLDSSATATAILSVRESTATQCNCINSYISGP